MSCWTLTSPPVRLRCTSTCCATRTARRTDAIRSEATIAKKLHLSRNTVAKHVRLLEERGFIVTEHTTVITKQGVKRNGNLLYTLIPMHEVMERFYDQQLCALDESAARSRAQARLAGQSDV